MSGTFSPKMAATIRKALAVAYQVGREGASDDIKVIFPGPISPQALADLNRQVAIAWAAGWAETERQLRALERAPVPKGPKP